MSIPGYNSQGVIPPHNGDATDMHTCSPYPATTVELCAIFGNTPERRTILQGFLKMRALMTQLELTEGFQWVDGRFVEKDRGRRPDPEHLQVVTFYKLSDRFEDPQFSELADRLRCPRYTLKHFRVHHDIVNLGWELMHIINHTRFHAGQLSHQKDTGIWKGMLQIALNTPEDDGRAVANIFAERAPGTHPS